MDHAVRVLVGELVGSGRKNARSGFVIGNNVFLGKAPVGDLQGTASLATEYETAFGRLQITLGSLDQPDTPDVLPCSVDDCRTCYGDNSLQWLSNREGRGTVMTSASFGVT